MKEIPLSNKIDLATTLNSGQVFHWDQIDPSTYVGAIDQAPVILKQFPNNQVSVLGLSKSDAEHYLGLQDNLTEIQKTFPQEDLTLQQAIEYAPYLRILRQPKWECLATFITSSLKQIPQIRTISLRIREELGTKVQINGHVLYTYPSPAKVAQAGETKLRELGLGYRAKSVYETAKFISSGHLYLESIDKKTDLQLESDLIQCRGVGEKIARCVMLFAYTRPRSFPVDTWIQKALHQIYFPNRRRDRTLSELHQFAQKHYGEHSGYAQQYLFHWSRTSSDSPWNS